MTRTILLALLVSAPAFAQTQVQMNAEAARDYRAADARLNAEWRLTLAALREADRDGSTKQAAALLTAQRAWLAFRDAHCVSEAARYAGGSMQSMVVAACKTQATALRTAQLRKLRSPEP